MLRHLIFLLSLCWATVCLATPNANTKYFSDDANIILHLDVQRLQKGATPQHLLGLLMSNPESRQNINRLKDKFGIDPFKDIQSVTMLIKIREQNQDPLVLVHLTGKFDQAQFIKGLTEQGNQFTQETVNGQIAHVSAANNSALTFVSDGVLLGTPEWLLNSLKGTTFGGTLKEQQDKLSTGGDLWFAAQISEKIRASIKQSNPIAADSKSMRGYLDFAQGLDFLMVTEFVSPEVSADVATRLKLAVDQMKQSPQMAMFMNMINKVAISTTGPELSIHMPLSQDDMNQVQAIASMLLMSLSMQQPQIPQTPPAPSFPQLDAPVSPSSPPVKAIPKAIPAKPETQK